MNNLMVKYSGFSLSDQLSSYVSNCLLNSFNQKQGVKTAAELCSIVCALPSASDSERESIILRLLGQGYTWYVVLARYIESVSI